MKYWILALAPWMAAASALAQSDGARPAEVVFTHYGKISTPAWQIGQDCFVPIEAVTRWGWKAKLGRYDVTLTADDRTAKMAFRNQGGRPVLNLGLAARKFGGGAEWKSGSGTFVVYSVVRSVAVRDGVISVDSTLPIKPKLSFLDGPMRMILDFHGAKLDSKAKQELVSESRVGQFEPTTFRIVVETNKQPALNAQSIRPSRDFELNYGSAPERHATSTPEGPLNPPVTDPTFGTFQSTINDFGSTGGSPPHEDVPQPMATSFVKMPTIAKQTEKRLDLQFRPSGPLMSTPQIKRIEPNVFELTLPGAQFEGELGAQIDSEMIQATSIIQGPASAIFTFVLKRPMAIELTNQKGVVILGLIIPKVGDGRLSSKTIVVDAGHGGHDGGARAPDGSASEKWMTLSISKLLSEALLAEGAAVIMTRNDDTFIPLKERPAIGTRSSADFFVSIHINSSASRRSSTGGMTFYHGRDAIGQLLAECIQTEIAKVSKLKSHGAWSDYRLYDEGLAVLRLSTMPAVLIEMGFINNTSDRTRMLTKDFQVQVSNAIVKGIKVFIGDESK